MARYQFGGIRFTSKADVKKHIYQIRDSYMHGSPIYDEGHIQFLCDLISCHPEAHEKMGPGIKYFYVDLAPGEWGGICFHVMRIDDTFTDWSYNVCLMSIEQINRASLRLLIRPQIKAVRRMYTGTHFISEYSGMQYPIDELHIDHVKPFKDVVDEWASQEGINLSENLLTATTDSSCEPVFRDAMLAKRFYEYHKSVALRPVSKLENIGVIKRRHNL